MLTFFVIFCFVLVLTPLFVASVIKTGPDADKK